MLPIQLVIVIAALCIGVVDAFSAGYIPPQSWLEGHAYRHGDIEEVLEKYIAQNPNGTVHGWQFEKEDVKRIYFGNWLRDYSQIADTSAFSFLNLDELLSILSIVGFLNFGYSGSEYEITSDRLGVYLPVQHIDNPNGYNSGKDARVYDPRLRGPVLPVEIVIDPKTGMKNYIANESGTWDTTTKYIRRTLIECVEKGRDAHTSGKQGTKNDAYRLLGAALGNHNVFPFVGNKTKIRSPTGRKVYPLVTGTFGERDAVHSLLGEVADYLSQSSLTALKEKVQAATDRQQIDNAYRKSQVGELTAIQHIISNITAKTEQRAASAAAASASLSAHVRHRFGLFNRRRSLHDYEKLRHANEERRALVARDMSSLHRHLSQMISSATPSQNPIQMASNEMHKAITKLTSLQTNVEAKLMEGTKHVVDDLVHVRDSMESLRDNLSVYVLKALQPLMTPLISILTQNIYKIMNEVLISSADEWEVFNNTQSTNPTHSLLSKDHFRIILNEPAGMIAQLSVLNAVDQVVQLWTNHALDVSRTIDRILECLFHPDFSHEALGLPRSLIQRQMTNAVKTWLASLPDDQRDETLRRLTKDQIAHSNNVRFQVEGGTKAIRTAVKQQILGSKSSVVGSRGHSHFGGPTQVGDEDTHDSHLGLDGMTNVTMGRALDML
ncbi:hypothetical protein FRB96_005414 [Tulasnella sp. 330]|nr:hypothetical protein FRB96_005414 [Tulasnella sp. 330]